MSQDKLYVPKYPGQGSPQGVGRPFTQSRGGGGGSLSLPFWKNFVDFDIGAVPSSDFIIKEDGVQPMIVDGTGMTANNMTNVRYVACDPSPTLNSWAGYTFPSPVDFVDGITFQIEILGDPTHPTNQAGLFWGISKATTVFPVKHFWDTPEGEWFFIENIGIGGASTVYVRENAATLATGGVTASSQKAFGTRLMVQMDADGRVQTWLHHSNNGFFKYYHDLPANASVAAWLANGEPFMRAMVGTDNAGNQYIGAVHMGGVHVTTGDLLPYQTALPDSFGG